MNVSDFAHNIDSNSIPFLITHFFDEIMVLYHLIGDRQDLDICGDNESSVATFMLLMESEDDARKLYDTLNNTEFSVYDTSYYIEMELSDSTVKTKISRATS